VNTIAQLWRTSTVRLTATFILIFGIFSILLLGFIGWQSSISIQRQQADGPAWLRVRRVLRESRRGGEAQRKGK